MLCTVDESLQFEELRAYDPASGEVLLTRRFILGSSLGYDNDIGIDISIASTQTFHSTKTQNLIWDGKGFF